MDNLCLFGLGLVGLVYFSSKNNNLLTNTDKSKTLEKQIVHVDSNEQLDVIVNNLMANKFMKVENNTVVWEVSLDEIFNHELHPFVGLDYFKIDNNNNNMTTIGRYIEISDEFKEVINKFIPELEYCHVLKYNNGKILTLVKVTDSLIPLSAIKLNFIENVNRNLSFF